MGAQRLQQAPMRMRQPARAVLLMPAVFLVLILSAGSTRAYEVVIDTPAPLQDVLRQFLDLSRYSQRADLNEDQFNFMLATAEEQVQELAAIEGYFSPKTRIDVKGAGASAVVNITVEPGTRTVIAATSIDVSGDAATEAPQQAARVRSSWGLRAGRPFRQEDWDSAKERGLNILRTQRFASAEIAQSRAEVHAGNAQARLSVTYDSGPAYTIGPLQISGTSRYPERIIHNVNPLREGEPYDAERMLELQRQIQSTPYFSNATVDIVRDRTRAKGAPVEVKVSEFPTQHVRGSTGFTTDTGARLQGRYGHNNVFGRAWVFDSQLALEQRRQLAAIGLSMPPDDAAFVNNVHTSLERTTLAGIDLRSRRVGLRRARSTQKYDLAWTLEYYSDELQQLSGAALPANIAVQPGNQRALVAGGRWTRRQLDSLVFPRNGHVLNVEAGAAMQGLLSDQSFVRVLLRGKKYSPVGRRDLVLLRADFGAVITKGGDASIPASLLFRAGGTDSVRGYTYQSIGNERNGVVYPTRFLAAGSAEYQHWLSRSWGAAVFYDVGTATGNWPERAFFHALGVGARWRSPVGTINADLGYGIQRRQLRPHISLGIAF
jgi:translocation and assembly module TamA